MVFDQANVNESQSSLQSPTLANMVLWQLVMLRVHVGKTNSGVDLNQRSKKFYFHTLVLRQHWFKGFHRSLQFQEGGSLQILNYLVKSSICGLKYCQHVLPQVEVWLTPKIKTSHLNTSIPVSLTFQIKLRLFPNSSDLYFSTGAQNHKFANLSHNVLESSTQLEQY